MALGFAGVSGPDEGAAGPARRCRAAWASPLNLQPQKKHNIWKKPLCTWYSGFFHCEKIRDSGRGRAERRISGVGFRWCAAPRLRTWCTNPRKTLFFRPQTPRLSDPKRRRRTGRGASLPANPYSFVRKHHVPRSGWADAGTDVVLHTPQSLISSSRSTTSPAPDGIGKGSADEFAIRLHFLPLLFCIDRKSSGAIAPLLFLHNLIKFYYFTFPLLFGAV